jgi:plasmid stability protein
MNYAAHYERLITRARGRLLVTYRERHHIVPRCMGGDDTTKNVVELTGEEHYVAHQLLVKMYPRSGKLAHAAMTMARRCSGNKAYGWLRRKHAEACRESWTPERRAELSAAQRGKSIPAETRKKIANAMRGNKNPSGKARSLGHRQKLSAARIGKKASDETRAKISVTSSNRRSSVGTRQKISASLLGNTRAAGSSPSSERRQKTGDRFRGMSLSKEHRAKISAALVGNKNAVGWRVRKAGRLNQGPPQ